jgi:hypothetical protein
MAAHQRNRDHVIGEELLCERLKVIHDAALLAGAAHPYCTGGLSCWMVRFLGHGHPLVRVSMYILMLPVWFLAGQGSL